MTKLDPTLTRKVQEWLNTPADERDIIAGATLYLQLSRNKALYNSVISKPQKFLPKLEYELRKYLRIRLDNMASKDIVKLESEVMPRVGETVALPPISPDDEFPDPTVARGRRMDHAFLPPEIQALWDSNGDRYQKIVLLFNELKGMADCPPCDRYEKLVILDELDKKYRANLKRYDAYVLEADFSSAEIKSASVDIAASDEVVVADSSAADAEPATGVDVARKISAARKYISSNKKILAGLDQSDPKAPALRTKIQEAVDLVRTLGGGFAAAQESELSQLGIVLN
ncbi:MAG: hypothetical protein NC212_08990 [Staphylococcus sp.]|nr:hypothetical protein [Staphylococcus sp.]